MELNKLSLEEARIVMSGLSQADRAALAVEQAGADADVYSLVINLTTAQLLTDLKKVSVPFRSVYVADATDSSVSVNLIVGTRDSFQSAVPLYKKDSLIFPIIKRESYLYWSAQAGKTITLLFFTSGEFRTGSQVFDTQSSADGSSITDKASVAVTTAITSLIAANSSRGMVNFYNAGPDIAYIGGSAVTIDTGSFPGMPVAVGEKVSYKNTGAIYAVSVSTSTFFVQEES